MSAPSPPPLRYRLTLAARRDLRGIWRYIADEGSERYADGIVDELTERFEMLGDHPYAGTAREDQGPGLRGFPVRHCLILYRVGPPGAVIVRVWDQRQDPEQLRREMKR